MSVIYITSISKKVWDKIDPSWFYTAGGFKLSSVKKEAQGQLYTIKFELKNGQQFGFVLPEGT